MSIGDAFLNLHPEPYPGYKFYVFIDCISMGFSKVTNIEESIETTPFHEGGVNDRVYSMRAPVQAEKILVLERGMANRGLVMSMLNKTFAVGRRVPGDILILVSDRTGVIANIYQVHGAVVKKCAVSDLNAMNSDLLIERFEVAYETMESFPMAAGMMGSAMSAIGFTIL